MDGKYTFNEFKQNLDDGYQIYFTYVRNRYLLFKTSENCYTQKLLTDDEKNPQPRHSMLTFKRIKQNRVCKKLIRNTKKLVHP